MDTNNSNDSKEKLVVEVVAAQNMLGKDGESSYSLFVEVEFEDQRLKTTQVNKEEGLNPVWNEKLVFRVKNVADLPRRHIKVSVFKVPESSKNEILMGKVRISGSYFAKEGKEVEKFHKLDKKSLFSHQHGEISLKLYLSIREELKAATFTSSLSLSKRSRKLQQRNASMKAQPQQVTQVNPVKPGEIEAVEQLEYLYVRIVKARNIRLSGAVEVVAEVKLGNLREITKTVNTNNLKWDQVFALSKDRIETSIVQIFVKEKDKEDYFGRIWFDLKKIPTRVPSDAQLAPKWYQMEDMRNKTEGGEVMVSIWFGTQADEAFANAGYSRVANVGADNFCPAKSKVYFSPKLWYLRVRIIEGQDIISFEKRSTMAGFPELLARAQVGNQILRTKIAPVDSNRSLWNPYWNEEILFVVAEPFDEYLLVSVENRVGPGQEEVLGGLLVPITGIERRTDEQSVSSRWYNLDHHFKESAESKFMTTSASSRILLHVSLDGGYNVIEEAPNRISDFRPTMETLWKPCIGEFEIDILGARLVPMKIRQGTGPSNDAYCVAKYGKKWIRTRTVVNSLSPKWNERHTWEVFDLSTVIVIGVFDDCHVCNNATNNAKTRDSRIGKVHIRLSTLESGRVYTDSYPLLVMHPSGVKQMGELDLVFRLSCSNLVKMLHKYTQPLQPKMHYVSPLGTSEVDLLRYHSMNMLADRLRYHSMNVLASRLAQEEPPLRKEVVEYVLDSDSLMWSLRKSKANFFRLMSVFSGLFAAGRLIDSMCNWHRPTFSILFLALFLLLVVYPELIIPGILLYIFLLVIWRHRFRPHQPVHIDTKLSHAESVHPDELDEEFDTFPTSRPSDIVRMRYDRLRSIAGRLQSVAGDVATHGERVQALLCWRDRRATFLFAAVCLLAAVGFYAMPKLVVALWGLYVFRPPRFRSKLPPTALSFFLRLPSKVDSLL